MKSLRIFLAGSILVLLSAQTSPAATQALDYDANGNLISGKGKYYEYNDANKLVRVRESSKEGPVIAQFWYDYQGQRVKKEENGITTYYLGKQYEERKGPSTNEKTNFYFAAGQRVARKTQKDTKPAETFYYFNNHLGSPEVVTNAAGTVLDRMTYDPFGSIRTTGSERYSYTGKEKDNATGQYYYEARYYDAMGHHFTQADTVTPNVYDPQSLNRYAYVVNNPVIYIDPSGNVWWNPLTWKLFSKNENSKKEDKIGQKSEQNNSSEITSTSEPKLPIAEHDYPTIREYADKHGGFSDEKGFYSSFHTKIPGKEYTYEKDIDGFTGQDVDFFRPGVVVDVHRVDNNAYGLYVKVKRPDGKIDLYAHLDSINKNLSKGDYVYPGISKHDGSMMKMGDTGWSDGDHLHFETRFDGKLIEP